MQQRTMFGTMSTSTVCPNCRGEGKDYSPEVQVLRRQRRRARQKKVSVKIPAGIDNGQAISVRGQGDMGRNGGPAGDLIVGINVRPHSQLRREGSHIYLDQAVSVLQATWAVRLRSPLWTARSSARWSRAPSRELPSACGAGVCPSSMAGAGAISMSPSGWRSPET